MAIGQEEIGRRVKQARDEAGLTQQELAERVGLKNGANLSRIERGKTRLTTKRMMRIADATKKPVEFFVREPSRDGNHDGEAKEGQQDYVELRELVLNLAQAVEAIASGQSRLEAQIAQLRRDVGVSRRQSSANGEH